MKYHLLIALLTAALLSACNKQTDADREAEIERQVQQRLAAQQAQQAADQRAADLDAREKALSAREAANASTPAPAATQTALSTTGDASVSSVNNSNETGGDTYNTFYTRLENYGDWIQTNDYGYVFHPREASSGNWRPYTNGRWVHTDAGWTWVSGEPFGWATYHYGRWTRLENVGWVWVPGEQWAPAWVSWRTSDDYVGWAPLPPEARFDRQTGIHNWSDNYYNIGPQQYAFVPTASLGDQDLARAVVAPEQNVTIINRTTNVTSITYNNTIVVNNGPNFEQWRSRSRIPIASMRLERQTNSSPDARTVIRGEVVDMPAPVIHGSEALTRPRTVQRTVTAAVVDRGWSGIKDRNAEQQARAKMESEAKPPAGLPPRTVVKPATAAAPPVQFSRAPVPPAAQVATPAVTQRPPAPTMNPPARETAIEQQKAAGDQAAKASALQRAQEMQKATQAQAQQRAAEMRQAAEAAREQSQMNIRSHPPENAPTPSAPTEPTKPSAAAHPGATENMSERERLIEAARTKASAQQAEQASAAAKSDQEKQAEAGRKAAEARTREESKTKPAHPTPSAGQPTPQP